MKNLIVKAISDIENVEKDLQKGSESSNIQVLIKVLYISGPNLSENYLLEISYSML